MSDSGNDLPELDMSAVLKIQPQSDATPTPQPPQPAPIENTELEDISLGDLDAIFDDIEAPQQSTATEDSSELNLDDLSIEQTADLDTSTLDQALADDDEPTGEFDLRRLSTDDPLLAESSVAPNDAPSPPEQNDAPILPSLDFSDLDIDTGQIDSPFNAEIPPDADAPIIPLGDGEPAAISALRPEDLPETLEVVKKLTKEKTEQKAISDDNTACTEEMARAAFVAAIDGENFCLEELPEPKLLMMWMVRVMANTMGNREDFIDALDSIFGKNQG